MIKRAQLSADRAYRYTLERTWDVNGPSVLFVMLNPSTADALEDDATIRRCIGYARSWGYGGLIVWNLYALRATDPRVLDMVSDPIGRENEAHLWRILEDDVPPALIVCAWGAKPNRGRYGNRELMMLVGPLYDSQLYVLKLTKDGHPHHPLRLRADLQPQPWHGPREPR